MLIETVWAMFLLTIAAFFNTESCCSEYLDALIVFRFMWFPTGSSISKRGA